MDYPLDQTCCGQPMANAGFESESVEMARHFDRKFKDYDYIVGPSASCVVFVRDNYGRLLKAEEHHCASEERIYDLCEFIHDVIKPTSLQAKFPHKVSLQNSCHGVRLMGLSSPSELNIPYFNKLRDLLSLVEGIEIMEPTVLMSVVVSEECFPWRKQLYLFRWGMIRCIVIWQQVPNIS